ncbi:MAG TPA: aldo/keto reductase [Ktedonobacterales bacterium]|jgi:aryl-alcohol dehydrogenase-like predicted oxidoreductase
MEYRQLGRSGLRVSVIGLGGNTFGRTVDAAGTEAIVARALDLGMNLIDTADIYSAGQSEEHVGRALRGRREQAIVATKVGMRAGDGPNDRGSSRKRVIEGCEASLRRLGIEAIDLYQIHEFDPDTPLAETLGALDDLVRAGKVRYIGCSNYAAWQVAHALGISERERLARFVSVQPEYNLLQREVERELLPCCEEFGLGVIPFFPLGAGVLTGKYRPGQPPPEGTRGHNNPGFQRRLHPEALSTVERLDAWARERGHTSAELALAWLLAQPAVRTVIPSARRPEQVEANARAADWHLAPDDLHAVETLLTGAEA